MIQKKRAQNNWIVTKPEMGLSLQEYLSNKMQISKRAAKNHIDARVVRVNGALVWMARHTLKKGDSVSVAVSVKSPTAISSRPESINILYEDDFCIIADKPRGILSNNSVNSVENILRTQTGNPELRAAHRLDRDTTGCLLFAKNPAGREKIIEVFKRHNVIKTYNAVVAGVWDADASTIGLELEGMRAVTHIKRISSNRLASFLAIRIETGRTHQIRRHLAMARHPVLGDSVYGLKTPGTPILERITYPLLHAASLALENPWTGGTLSAFSPLPAEFHHFLSLLGLSAKRR